MTEPKILPPSLKAWAQDHVGIVTPDLDRLRSFYEHTLGLRLVVIDRPDGDAPFDRLGVFAAGTAASMALASTSVGFVMSRNVIASHAATVLPAMGALSLAFGAWYAVAAVQS